MGPFAIVSLWDVLKAYAEDFVAISAITTRLREACVYVPPEDNTYTPKATAAFMDHVEALREITDKHGLAVSSKALARIETVISEGVPKLILIQRLDHFREVFEDELSAISLYQVPHDLVGFLNPETPLFGAGVEKAFPKAAEDIAEAGRCLALGLPTAAVFHLMRTLELAVQVMSRKLGIKNTEREWGKLLSDLHGKIGDMSKGEKRNRWSEIHANLYHVKQAWRNDVMHPKKTYTEAQAREVFEAMRVFMVGLADLAAPRSR